MKNKKQNNYNRKPILLWMTAAEQLETEDKTKLSVGTIKQIFYQPSINIPRPKLTIQINVIDIEGLVDIGAYVTIIVPISWHPKWLLQEVDI